MELVLVAVVAKSLSKTDKLSVQPMISFQEAPLYSESPIVDETWFTNNSLGSNLWFKYL